MSNWLKRKVRLAQFQCLVICEEVFQNLRKAENELKISWNFEINLVPFKLEKIVDDQDHL